jgi:hypothetical protein
MANNVFFESLKLVLDSIIPLINFDDPKYKNVPLIIIVGQILLEKYPDIKDARKAFVFDPTILNSNNMIIDFIRDNLIDIINFTNFTIEIVHKPIDMDGLKPHFDNYQLVKNNPKENFDRFIHIKNKTYLHRILEEPIYTFLFYRSTYGVDFTGGLLHLVDGTVVIPKVGEGFMMSSKEAHYVEPHNGIREVTVVKIYPLIVQENYQKLKEC